MQFIADDTLKIYELLKISSNLFQFFLIKISNIKNIRNMHDEQKSVK